MAKKSVENEPCKYIRIDYHTLICQHNHRIIILNAEREAVILKALRERGEYED